MKKENQGLQVRWGKKTKVYRLDEEREPRFTGLQVGWKKRTKVYRLDGEREPRFTDCVKKENQGL